MDENELPLGRGRTRAYRFFEMLPAVLSFGVPVAIVIVSLIQPSAGAVLVLVFVGATLLRTFRGAIDGTRGYRALRAAESTDWMAMNAEIERVLRDGRAALPFDGRSRVAPGGAIGRDHARLAIAAARRPYAYPLPSEVVHAVLVTAYNEPYEVVRTSIQALTEATVGAEQLVVLLAYEARGGEAMRATARRLEQEYGYRFRAFEAVEHPADLPDEIPGKGANLTFAGRRLERWVAEHGIDPERVVVTSLDCDNRPHPDYFAAVTYQFVRATDRARASFQPISLFTNNIWHAPAPMRVIAAGNSIWNLISTVRPFSVRNFASHAQPLPALIDMGFWSRRTIVEDGHQFWRSYFHFRGQYRAIAVRIPIYQDAVLTEEFLRTLKAQFSQLARWAYGASDVPYVGVRVFSRRRRVPFWTSFLRFLILVEGHVSLAVVAPLILVGAWIPLLIGQAVTAFQVSLYTATQSWLEVSIVKRAFREDDLVADLPAIVDTIQRIAMPGLVTIIVLSILLLPTRPREFGRSRSVAMLAQWIMLPITAVAYTAGSSLYSQGRLFLGRYRERFDVTEKAAAGVLRDSLSLRR